MPRDLLKVRLNEISDRGLDLAFAPADPRYAAILAEIAGGDGATGNATVRLEEWPERVDVRGQVTAHFPQQCCRCLEPFTLTIERDVNQVLMKTGTAAPEAVPDQEIELSLRDLDRSELVGEEIDLGEILREELVLAMPSKPLCRDACKGICAGCGAELNSEPCTCVAQTDPRWDVLKQLKLD